MGSSSAALDIGAIGASLVLSLLLSTACDSPKTTEAPATTPGAATVRAPATLPNDEASWGKYHSKRFQLTLPLPDGHAWHIDDHSRPTLVATHEATSSRVEIEATQEDTLMNRAKCEERARAIGFVPEARPLTTVEDEAAATPEAYDSRVWVALDPGKPGGALEGHVFLFGAYLRRCLLVHYTTRVASLGDEEIMSARLAVAYKAVRNIKVDGPRTTDDAQLPRESPEIRR